MAKPKDRPVTGDQRKIYGFFKIEVGAGLTSGEAQGVIDELFEDMDKRNAWDSYVEHLEGLVARDGKGRVKAVEGKPSQDRMFDREGWLTRARDYANEDAEFYGCKKLTEGMFRRTVGLLEAKGVSLEEIDADSGVVFEAVLEIDPGVKSSGKKMRKRRLGCGVVVWSLILILLLVGIYYVYWDPRS